MFIGVEWDYFVIFDFDLFSGCIFNVLFDIDEDVMIINEVVLWWMNLENLLVIVLYWDGELYLIIGVVEDVIMESFFDFV